MKTNTINDFNICTIADVREFFRFITDDMGLVWHPDDSFTEEWIYDEDGDSQISSWEEATKLDSLMLDCFRVCEKYNEDIYKISFEEIDKYLSGIYIDEDLK